MIIYLVFQTSVMANVDAAADVLLNTVFKSEAQRKHISSPTGQVKLNKLVNLLRDDSTPIACSQFASSGSKGCHFVCLTCKTSPEAEGKRCHVRTMPCFFTHLRSTLHNKHAQRWGNKLLKEKKEITACECNLF